MTEKITSIDEVIKVLDEIIVDAEKSNSTMGYFAALYRKVTIKVKEGIENNFFENGPRMEKLDVVFALRYIEAYSAWKNNSACTVAWKYTFDHASQKQFIVLQHLLLGMNAHINLDLGIAAAQVAENANIDDLENDFNKINEILSSLVIEVENNLSKIWPLLKRILKWTNKVDDFLVDFSMELARDGAWKFAKSLSPGIPKNIAEQIKTRDQKVAQKASIVTHPGKIPGIILQIVRWGEKGTVADKIRMIK